MKVLKTALEMKLPKNGIKAKLYIKSHIKTLKMQSRIIHEMLIESNCRSFGWDPEKKIMTIEKAVGCLYSFFLLTPWFIFLSLIELQWHSLLHILKFICLSILYVLI